MPDVADYVLAKPRSNKLGYGKIGSIATLGVDGPSGY